MSAKTNNNMVLLKQYAREVVNFYGSVMKIRWSRDYKMRTTIWILKSENSILIEIGAQ